MSKRLPKTDGIDPIAGRLKINGFSNTLDDANKPGTKVWFVVEAEIKEVGLRIETAGPIRLERAEIIRHCPIAPEDAEARLNAYAEYLASEEPEQQELVKVGKNDKG